MNLISHSLRAPAFFRIFRAFRGLLFFLILLTPTLTFAADVKSLIARAEALDKKFQNAEALALFLQAEAAAPKNPRVLRGLAKQCSELVLDATTEADKKSHAEKSIAYAKRAVEAAPKDALCQLTLAICYGRAAGVVDSKTRIEYSKLIKHHADLALALDPKNDLTHFVLGTWNYELASLNFALRAIARVVYGALPSASYADALTHLQKAATLNPNRVSVQNMLGQTHIALGNKPAARQAFERAVALPARDKGDDTVKRDAQAALKKLE